VRLSRGHRMLDKAERISTYVFNLSYCLAHINSIFHRHSSFRTLHFQRMYSSPESNCSELLGLLLALSYRQWSLCTTLVPTHWKRHMSNNDCYQRAIMSQPHTLIRWSILNYSNWYPQCRQFTQRSNSSITQQCM